MLWGGRRENPLARHVQIVGLRSTDRLRRVPMHTSPPPAGPSHDAQVMTVAKTIQSGGYAGASLSGIGGVSTGYDAAEFLLVGADTVQVRGKGRSFCFPPCNGSLGCGDLRDASRLWGLNRFAPDSVHHDDDRCARV